ncbi:hypothetical protein JMJ35_004621 [Cladonia borealis]|uniref:Ankyrin repeat protein n=1 Tax=Cladonia borealis TaxID=184061 RepID=A0AA39R2G0_9LECA|nr:hypothetical protein JMJ35_004621 [Cladonia borealis]
MTDPLSISASIIASLQLTGTIVSYLQDVREASEERQRILNEITKRTAVPFKQALERLASKLATVTGFQKAGKSLLWPFQKREISEILGIIERQKTYFVLALQNKNSELSQALKNDLGSVQDSIKGLGDQISGLQLGTQSQDTFRWFKPVDPSSNHASARNKHEQTTGTWLISNDVYVAWKACEGSLLWLNGKVGCGKTILCSTLIEDVLSHCQFSPQYIVCYYYFDFQDPAKRIHESLIRSLLNQLANQHKDCTEFLQQLFHRCQHGKQQPSHDALTEALQRMFHVVPGSYILIDALDECVDRYDLLRLIRSIAGWGKGVQVLVTSRKERDIESVLSSCANYQLNVQNEDVDADIRLYVRKKIRDDTRLSAWPEDVQQGVEHCLSSGANGMFRWAVCQLDAIRKCLKLPTLMRTLKTLPKTLDDTYLRILCGIEEEDRNDALKVLQWLTSSARPMLLDEVAEVVAIDLDDDPEFDTTRRLRSPHDILTICSSLVVLSTSEQIVDSQFVFKDAITLAHLSVKDYLTSGRIVSSDAKDFQISRKSAHRCIAEMCLSYLAVNGPILNDENVMQYPLSRYAAEYWIEHVLKAGEKEMYPRINVLFTSFEFITSWVRLYDPDYPFEESNIFRDEATIAGPLYYASLCGLADTARELLATGADPNEKGALYFDPLEAAASKGYDEIVQTLLENGALLRTDVGVYGSALQAATMMGHTKVALTILRHGSVVPQKLLNACLYLAAQSGNTDMIVLFIEYGADINYEDPTHGGSLRVAAREGYENAVQTLLRKGASVNIKGGKAASALEGAARQAHERIVHLLIAAKADVNLGGG